VKEALALTGPPPRGGHRVVRLRVAGGGHIPLRGRRQVGPALQVGRSGRNEPGGGCGRGGRCARGGHVGGGRQC
jgi:hypothetical protein